MPRCNGWLSDTCKGGSTRHRAVVRVRSNADATLLRELQRYSTAAQRKKNYHMFTHLYILPISSCVPSCRPWSYRISRIHGPKVGTLLRSMCVSVLHEFKFIENTMKNNGFGHVTTCIFTDLCDGYYADGSRACKITMDLHTIWPAKFAIK